MVSGHLQEKNNYYYAVLTYKDANGKRHQPWINTGFTVKGNKKKAEKRLFEIRKDFIIPQVVTKDGGEFSSDMLYADYLLAWFEVHKMQIQPTTIAGYEYAIKKHIEPYFRKKKITLGELKAKDIRQFNVSEKAKGLAGSTLVRQHAIIRNSLKNAFWLDLVPCIEVDKIDRPKKEKYLAEHYSLEELEKLFELTKDHRLALLIQMTAFYGFRREEVVGLKWDAIDFENNVVTVQHTVTEATIDGVRQLIQADRAKTQSSVRSLPLVGQFREKLLALKEQQERNKKVCGNCYDTTFEGYVFVNEMGKLYMPGYVSSTFGKLLENSGLKRIRFHDLRHSCASLMLNQGVPLKQIQEWLGHSDIGTTSNIYAHLESASKVKSAGVLDNVLKIPKGAKIGW